MPKSLTIWTTYYERVKSKYDSENSMHIEYHVQHLTATVEDYQVNWRGEHKQGAKQQWCYEY